jgi:hypothetical protein
MFFSQKISQNSISACFFSEANRVIISNERLEDEVAYLRRLKMKLAAESKNMLLHARTWMNTHAQAKTKELTYVSD